MDLEGLQKGFASGEVVILDLRSDEAFMQGHIAGSSLATYTSAAHRDWVETVSHWQQAHSKPLVLIGLDLEVLGRVARALEDEGTVVAGVVENAIEQWETTGMNLARIGRITSDELVADAAEWRVIDVREPHEWQSGIIAGAILMSLGAIPQRALELDPALHYAVICAHGQRSRLACNWLSDHGFRVSNVEGGMATFRGGRVSP